MNAAKWKVEKLKANFSDEAGPEESTYLSYSKMGLK